MKTKTRKKGLSEKWIKKFLYSERIAYVCYCGVHCKDFPTYDAHQKLYDHYRGTIVIAYGLSTATAEIFRERK